jgi:hypothetical protein
MVCVLILAGYWGSNINTQNATLCCGLLSVVGRFPVRRHLPVLRRCQHLGTPQLRLVCWVAAPCEGGWPVRTGGQALGVIGGSYR